jgi:hypothetical protein
MALWLVPEPPHFKTSPLQDLPFFSKQTINCNYPFWQSFTIMPVTLTTANHSATKWKYPKVKTAEQLLERSCPEEHRRCQKLIQHSFSSGLFDTSHVSSSEHGFVWAVFHAYSYHHHLTIRPEDVWFSILTQLSLFINAHAEDLRSLFVAHEGQKELTVTGLGTIENTDFGALALHMTKLIEENVVDEELRAWIMPDFTTTTESDNVVAAILMMGALQKYFSYKMMLLCGIPSVTLLGEKKDWTALVKKLDKLQELGDEPARFAQLLRPVLNHFVASFESPESLSVRDFWSKCADKESMGSGPSYLSGWISVFCFWDENGKMIYDESIYAKTTPEFEKRNTEMGLDDALSRRVDIDDIPSGFSSVPVTVDDNGVTHHTTMLAGLIGIQAKSSGEVSAEGGEIDSIQPLSGWWMYEKRPVDEDDQQASEA